MAKHHAKAKKQRQMKIESYSTDDNLDIGSTGLSKRSKNTLIANGINTIRDAKNLYIEQGEIGFFKLCGLGRISLNEIMIFMKLKSLPHKR